MTNAEVVLFEQSGPVASVTLNRPALHNAFNDEVVTTLAATWERVEKNADVQV